MDNSRTIQELAREFHLSEKVIRSKVRRLIAGGHLTEGQDYHRNPATGQYRVDPIRFYEGAKNHLGVWLQLPGAFAVPPSPTHSVSQEPQGSPREPLPSTHLGNGGTAATQSARQSAAHREPVADGDPINEQRERDRDDIRALRDRVHHLENKLEEKDRNHTETVAHLAAAHAQINSLSTKIIGLLAPARSRSEEGSGMGSRRRVEATQDVYPNGQTDDGRDPSGTSSDSQRQHNGHPQPTVEAEQGSANDLRQTDAETDPRNGSEL